METGDQGRRERRRQRANPRVRARNFQTLAPGRAPVGFVPAITIPPTRAVEDSVDTETDYLSEPGPTEYSLTPTKEQSEQPEPLSIQEKLHRLLSNDSVNTESAPPAPIPPQNMSTLGSMARAAEYAAAQSARARQVSRETEEQKLPPKPTPISLGAFTKGQPASRNKGNKAWKPLTTDDLGGDEDYCDTPISCEQIPFNPDNKEPRSTLRLLTRPAQGSTEDFKIPTAPKAMLAQRDRPVIFLNTTPRRVSAHPVINYPHPHNPQGLEGAPQPGIQGRLFFNVPHIPYRQPQRPQAAYLQDLGYIGAQANQPDAISTVPMLGHNLHPAAYLTPSREEIKEVVRERERQHMLNIANLQPGMSQQQQPPAFGIFSGSPAHYYNSTDYEIASYPQVHPPSYDITPPAFYPAQQNNMRTDAPNVFQSTPPSYQVARGNVNQPTTLYHPEYRKPDIPYNRTQTMELAKATLAKAALESKGKTVLHNPELHKRQGSPRNPASDTVVTNMEGGGKQSNIDVVPWSELEGMLELEMKNRDASFARTQEPKKSTQEGSWDVYKTTRTDAFAGNDTRYSLTAPPPGLELPMDGTGEIKLNGLKEFPDDFYTLKPLSLTEVKEVRRLAQEARDDLAGTYKQPFFSKKDELRGTIKQPLFSKKDGESVTSIRVKQAESWFYNSEPTPVQVAAKMHECAIRDKALAPKSEEEMATERAMILNVIGNVQTLFEQCKMPEDKRTFPFKIKPVPEYAIERPSVMTGGTSIFSSFFEDTSTKGEWEKAYIPTPKRIARDPRFRPTAPNEGKKLTIEEERLARRDSYGRRVVV